MSEHALRFTESIFDEAGLDEFLSIVTDLDDAGRELLIQALRGQLSTAEKTAILADLDTHIIDADTEIRAWLVRGISTGYVEGIGFADRELATFGFKGPDGSEFGQVTIQVLSTPEFSPHLAAVNTLLSEAYNDFAFTMRGFIQGAERIIDEGLRRQIRVAIALGRLEGSDIRTIAKTVEALFADRGFTVLIDRGGRQWSLANYSQMVTRTQIIKAANEGVINRMNEFDIDIVQVSAHGATDNLCEPQEGKIYSISGNSKNFPPLAGNEPTYHPNCKHILEPRPDLE